MGALVIGVAALAALLGIGLGILLGRYLWPALATDQQTAIVLARTEAERLAAEYKTLEQRAHDLDRDRQTALDQLATANAAIARLTERAAGAAQQLDDQSRILQTMQGERDTAVAERARLQERTTGLARQLEEQTALLNAACGERDAAAAEAKDAAAKIAGLQERETALTEKVTSLNAHLADQQKLLTTEFENIANRILKANASELSDSSQKALNAILDPLRERIQDFEKKVETTYDTETREVLSLKEQIKLVVKTSNTIGQQADGLAKALRGDSQLLGRWGELALERILEAAGLTAGREYIPQGRGLGLKSDAGGVQKPDIVVMLPEGRTMIVDSKTPLTNYERLIGAKDEIERATCAAQFVRDVKGHIDDLASKRYQDNDKLHNHDSVLMFVPIEGALAAALTAEPEIFTYGWDCRVVLVGPSTLLMTMRTVASIWRYELQGQHAQEIAKLAGDLCDKVSTSLTDLNGVADKINGALLAHNEAVKRLATGKGNALSIGQRIRSLGVKTKRPTPDMLVDGILIGPETDEEFAETAAK